MLLESIPPEVLTAVALIFGAIIAYIGGRKQEAAKKVIDLETHIRDALADAGVPSPTAEQVSIQTTEKAVKQVLPEGVEYNQDVTTIHADGTYFAVTPGDLDDLRLVANLVEYLPYRPERFDCDNFAELFAVLAAFFAGVNAVGTVYDWGGQHAYNLIVLSNGDPILYEPQSDEIIELNGEEYDLTNAMIMF